MGIFLYWNNWVRSDDCKEYTDKHSFAGVSVKDILYRGMNRVFISNEGDQGLLYQGQIIQAARIIRSAVGWNRWGFEETDMVAMLQSGLYTFGYNINSNLTIDISFEKGIYGKARSTCVIGHHPDTLMVQFEYLLEIANREFPKDDHGVDLLSDLIMGEVMHELMHTQLFTHQPATGQADKSFGSHYFCSLPHLAKLAYLGASGRWNTLKSVESPNYYVGGDYPQLEGLDLFDPNSSLGWGAYEAIDGEVSNDRTVGVVAIDYDNGPTDEVYARRSFHIRIPGSNPSPKVTQRWGGAGQWQPTSGWNPLPATPDLVVAGDSSLDGGVTVVSWAPGHRSLIATTGTRVIHRSYVDGTWSGWVDGGGNAQGDVAALVIPGTQLIDLYVRGLDGLLYQGHFRGLDQPFSWHSMGTKIDSPPCVVAHSSHSRHVFATSTADGLVGYHAWEEGYKEGRGWHPWRSIGGQVKGRVGAVALAGSRLDVYGRGMNDHLWQVWWDGDNWSNWYEHEDGLAMHSAPTVISRRLTHRDVFFVGEGGSVVHKTWKRQAPKIRRP